MKRAACLLCFIVLAAISALAASRTFTDSQGRTIEAEPLEKSDVWIDLRRTDGYQFRVSIERLSDEDRAWVQSWSPPHVPPPEVPAAPVFKRGERLTFQTVSGKSYTAAKVMAFQSDALIVLTGDGVYTIPDSELPDHLAARLPPATPPPVVWRTTDPFAHGQARPIIEAVRALPPKKTEKEIVDDLIDGAPLGYVSTAEIAFETGPEINVSGQVFIVTKGRSNVKLGLVTVSVVSIQQVEAVRAYEGSHILPWITEAIRTTKSFIDHAQVLRAFKCRERITERCYDTLRSAASGRTDADGKFTIITDLKPPFYLTANSSRTVGDNEEKYRWIVLVEDADTKRPVLLSNDNME